MALFVIDELNFVSILNSHKHKVAFIHVVLLNYSLLIASNPTFIFNFLIDGARYAGYV